MLVAGGGDENVADLRRVDHFHHAETVHRGFQCANRIDFRHDHVSAEAARRDAMPRPQ